MPSCLLPVKIKIAEGNADNIENRKAHNLRIMPAQLQIRARNRRKVLFFIFRILAFCFHFGFFAVIVLQQERQKICVQKQLNWN